MLLPVYGNQVYTLHNGIEGNDTGNTPLADYHVFGLDNPRPNIPIRSTPNGFHLQEELVTCERVRKVISGELKSKAGSWRRHPSIILSEPFVDGTRGGPATFGEGSPCTGAALSCDRGSRCKGNTQVQGTVPLTENQMSQQTGRRPRLQADHDESENDEANTYVFHKISHEQERGEAWIKIIGTSD